jgi:hypothetical protein
VVEFKNLVPGNNGVQQVQPQDSSTDAMGLNMFVIDCLYDVFS